MIRFGLIRSSEPTAVNSADCRRYVLDGCINEACILSDDFLATPKEFKEPYELEQSNISSVPKGRGDTLSQSRALPLRNCCFRSLIEFIELMLTHGADINAKDSVGRAPLHYAASWACQSAFDDDFQQAKWRGEVILTLLRHGANPSERCQGRQTPLMFATEAVKEHDQPIGRDRSVLKMLMDLENDENVLKWCNAVLKSKTQQLSQSWYDADDLSSRLFEHGKEASYTKQMGYREMEGERNTLAILRRHALENVERSLIPTSWVGASDSFNRLSGDGNEDGDYDASSGDEDETAIER